MGEKVAVGPSKVPTLQDERVTLRAPRASDIDDKLSIGRHTEIIRMYGGNSDFEQPTRDGAMAWHDRLAAHPHAWVIEIDGRGVGEIRLDHVDEQHRSATLAAGIGDPALLGNGLGTEAVRLVLRHAFTDLGLHRVGLRVLEYNTRAIRAYEKCGFVVEGRERQAANVDGKWYDDITMGVLADEYET